MCTSVCAHGFEFIRLRISTDVSLLNSGNTSPVYMLAKQGARYSNGKFLEIKLPIISNSSLFLCHFCINGMLGVRLYRQVGRIAESL